VLDAELISMTAQQARSAGRTAMIGALLSSLLWTGIPGNHWSQWEPFLSCGAMAVGLILPGRGQRGEKRSTVPENQQIEVSF
jgi:hypothetical protein